MKTISALVAALGLLAVAAPVLATSASAETVIIRRGHPHCQMVKVVRFGPHHTKIVSTRRVCR